MSAGNRIPPARRRRTVSWSRAAVLLLIGMTVFGGLEACNIITPVAYLIGGTPKIPATYILEPRTTVVFVDDRANVIPTNSRAIRLAIAAKVTEDIMTNEVLPPELVINSRDAMSIVLAKDRHSELLPMDAIGREVGAEVLIYIEMVSFSRAGPRIRRGRPRSAGSGSSIASTGSGSSRIRQTQEPARTVQTSTRAVDPSAFQTPSSALKIYQYLADETGKQIGKLFYQHDSRDLGDRLNPN